MDILRAFPSRHMRFSKIKSPQPKATPGALDLKPTLIYKIMLHLLSTIAFKEIGCGHSKMRSPELDCQWETN